MREVCVFLSPSLYTANVQFVDGLRKNDIQVQSFDVRNNDYASAVAAHHTSLLKHRPKQQQRQQQQEEEFHPFLCLAFEDSRVGVCAARREGLCVIGIASNRIEYDRLKSQGAHAASMSVADLLDSFGVRNYYQVQYLPYAIHLRQLAEQKVGYPISLLDTLRGRFVKQQGRVVEADPEDGDRGGDLVQLDEHAHRIIPREVLGILPGSLADVYINNIGWPQDNPDLTFRLNSKVLERDIIRMFAHLYQCSVDTMRGYVTSGGTEGNFTGLWWQRDYLRDMSSDDDEGQQAAPILLASEQTHYSIGKAAQQLDIEARAIRTRRTGEIDLDDLELKLNEIAQNEPRRPVLMSVNMGTTQTGALDDLPRVHRLLVEKVEARGGHFSIHMDAALMGAVIPIILPFENVDFFADYGVKTIAISGHKFFGSVCICGLLLTTTTFLDSCFARRDVSVRYLTGLHDITPSGSRSGFNVLSFHNTLCGLYMHTDANRLRQIVAQCYRNVDYFLERITKLVGSDYVIHPSHSLTVCFPRPSAGLMTRYSLMPVSMANSNSNRCNDDGTADSIQYAGVCILVNVGPVQIDKFLEDYARDYSGRKMCDSRNS